LGRYTSVDSVKDPVANVREWQGSRVAQKRRERKRKKEKARVHGGRVQERERRGRS